MSLRSLAKSHHRRRRRCHRTQAITVVVAIESWQGHCCRAQLEPVRRRPPANKRQLCWGCAERVREISVSAQRALDPTLTPESTRLVECDWYDSYDDVDVYVVVD